MRSRLNAHTNDFDIQMDARTPPSIMHYACTMYTMYEFNYAKPGEFRIFTVIFGHCVQHNRFAANYSSDRFVAARCARIIIAVHAATVDRIANKYESAAVVPTVHQMGTRQQCR